MKLTEKIGQMLMVGFDGTAVTPKDQIVKDIERGMCGGVILFSKGLNTKGHFRNIQTPAQVRALCQDLQSVAPFPLMIAADNEGGRVQRLEPHYGFDAVYSAKRFAALSYAERENCAALLANMCADVGINTNFAPVVDLNIEPTNPIIAGLDRSFSDDYHVVNECAEQVIRAHRAHHVISCIKHFPGHGSSLNDSHLGFVDITDTWDVDELEPYHYLIQNDLADMVMMGHLYQAKFDQRFPATLSYIVTTTMLREKLGFDGVIVSDDMEMSAIADMYPDEKAIELAINAGVDMLIYGNNLRKYNKNIVTDVLHTIVKLVETDKISEQRIDESVQRILRLKKKVIVSPKQKYEVGS